MGWRWMRLTGRWSTSRGRCGDALTPTLTLTPSEREPRQARSHQSICWNPGGHAAGKGIWEVVRDREEEALQAPRTRTFSSFIYFVYSFALSLLCLGWVLGWRQIRCSLDGEREPKHTVQL